MTPWIQSGQTNMSAGTILIVVFVGGALAGIPELLFAILIAACIKILLDEVVLRGLEDGPGSCNRLAYSTAPSFKLCYDCHALVSIMIPCLGGKLFIGSVK